MDITLANETRDGVTIVTVSGDLDIYTAPRFREHLARLRETGATRVALDLDDVCFLDSTCLGIIIGNEKHLRAAGGRSVIICTTERISKVFSVTGVARVFRITADAGAAITALAQDVPEPPGVRDHPRKHTKRDQMNAEITETPVTGMPGRTARDAIEAPLTGGREIEVTLLLDISGSNEEPAAPDSPLTKRVLVEQVLPLIVGALEGDDSQAAAEQSSGSDEHGGVRTFCFNEPGAIVFAPGDDESDDGRDLGDLNTSNVERKLDRVVWGGRTYIMPAVHAAETAFQAEFGDRPMRNRPACELLVITDGKLSDAGEFEKWVAQADETLVVCVAVIGYGEGHDTAVEHYQAIAGSNKYVTVVALTGVSDPMEVAYDLRLLSGTAAV